MNTLAAPIQGANAPARRLIVLAPTPPPVFGHSVLTLSVLASLRRLGLLAEHIDIRDARSLANLNHLDAENVRIGLLAERRLIASMLRHPDAAVYVQVSQGLWGFLRDALWVWTARALRRKVYIHLLGGRFRDFHDDSGPLMRALIRATVRQGEALWVLTPSLRECFDGLADPARVEVLENVVADPMAELAGARENGPMAGPPRILFLSNLREGKGYDDLLGALARLGEDAAGWHVRFVGEYDDAARAELEEWVESRIDPEVRVELAGSTTGSAKARELAWADVFAFPSKYRNEGQPLVVLEALAAGLAIVSTRHRGIPDTVREEREALLVEPGDVAGLASALARVDGDEELRSRLGAAARVRYEDRYSSRRLDEGLEELLSG